MMIFKLIFIVAFVVAASSKHLDCQSSSRDVISELDGYLKRKTPSDLFEDNKPYLDRAFGEGYFLGLAAEMILKVNNKKCSSDRVGFVEIVLRWFNKLDGNAFKGIKASRRVIKLLNGEIHKFFNHCFSEFERQWTETECKENGNCYVGEKELEILDNINELYSRTIGKYKGELVDLKKFDCALQRDARKMRFEKTFAREFFYKIEEMENLIETQQQHDSLAGNEGPEINHKLTKSRSTKKMRPLLLKYLVTPCEHLIQRQEKISLGKVPQLKDVIKLALLITLDDSIILSPNTYSLLTWASRHVTCKWLLEFNEKKIAKKLSKVSQKLNNGQKKRTQQA